MYKLVHCTSYEIMSSDLLSYIIVNNKNEYFCFKDCEFKPLDNIDISNTRFKEFSNFLNIIVYFKNELDKFRNYFTSKSQKEELEITYNCIFKLLKDNPEYLI